MIEQVRVRIIGSGHATGAAKCLELIEGVAHGSWQPQADGPHLVMRPKEHDP